jgi:adenosylcobinamide-GDP ribazoletransferase
MGWPVACFPLVGAALGGLVGALGLLLAPWFPPSVLAALLLAALLVVTGALHLDALMDSFDGLFGGKDPDGRLAIMRDSRVGSFGIAAAGSLLLIEYGTLASLSPEARLRALAVAGALSRGVMALLLAAFPAASPKGLAAGLKPQIRWYHAATAILLASAIAVGLLGTTGLAVVGLAGLLTLLGGRLALGKIGGVTGDVCGGLGELVEAVVLLACVPTSTL